MEHGEEERLGERGSALEHGAQLGKKKGERLVLKYGNSQKLDFWRFMITAGDHCGWSSVNERWSGQMSVVQQRGMVGQNRQVWSCDHRSVEARSEVRVSSGLVADEVKSRHLPCWDCGMMRHGTGDDRCWGMQQLGAADNQ